MAGDRGAATRPPNRVRVVWVGEHRFDAGRPDGPLVRIDGDGATGPSPVDALLAALAGCSGIDVVDILAKRRTPARALEVWVEGYRAEHATPRRVERIVLDYRVQGEGDDIDRAQAERAIQLALEKYCTVRDAIAPGIPIQWRLTLNGEPGASLTEARSPLPAAAG